MALQPLEKSAIRQHLKYGNIGMRRDKPGAVAPAEGFGPWFFENWTELEIRMDSLQPIDEAQLTGNPVGLVSLQGPDPAAEATLTLQFASPLLAEPVQVTYTAPNPMQREDFGLQFAAACAQNISLASAGIYSVMPHGILNMLQNELSQIQYTAKQAFTISVVAMSGIGVTIAADGSQMPFIQSVIDDQTYYGFLPILNRLYSLIGSSSDRLGIDKADVFVARKSEGRERRRLYIEHVQDMATFLVSKLNPLAPGRPSNMCSL